MCFPVIVSGDVRLGLGFYVICDVLISNYSCLVYAEVKWGGENLSHFAV